MRNYIKHTSSTIMLLSILALTGCKNNDKQPSSSEIKQTPLLSFELNKNNCLYSETSINGEQGTATIYYAIVDNDEDGFQVDGTDTLHVVLERPDGMQQFSTQPFTGLIQDNNITLPNIDLSLMGGPEDSEAAKVIQVCQQFAVEQ